MSEISNAKRAANRENAKKSTGPKTNQGKATSRLNALKHGLSAAIALPEELRETAEARVQEWIGAMNPRAGAEAWLVERAAMDSVRVDTVARCERARLAIRLQRDELYTRADGLAEVAVERQGTLLMETRWGNPAALVTLRATRAGCEWLITRWVDLQRRQQANGKWQDHEFCAIQRLLGTDIQNNPVPSEIAILCADYLLSQKGGTTENSMALLSLQRNCWSFDVLIPAGETPDTPETIARANVRLSQFIDGKITELVERRDRFYEVEAREAALASEGFLADFSPEGKLLHRYETELLRRVHQSLDHLAKLRKAHVEESDTPEKPSRNEANLPVSIPLQPSLSIRVPIAASSLDDASTIQILCSEPSRNEATASESDSTEPAILKEVETEAPVLDRPRNEANSLLNRPQPPLAARGQTPRQSEARI